MLLDGGADWTIRSSQGQTALDFAIGCGKPCKAVVKKLKLHIKTATSKTAKGKSVE